MQPNRPEHADKVVAIPGADPRLTLKRCLAGYAYAVHGNLHNPTPQYRWLLLADGKPVDQGSKAGSLKAAARQNGAAYLAEIDAQ